MLIRRSAIVLTVLLMGCGESESSPDPKPVAKEPEKVEPIENLSCDYLLEPNRFVLGGEVGNPGPKTMKLQVVGTWEQLGSEPIKVKRTIRLEPVETKPVRISIPATPQQIDAHQSADDQCEGFVRR